MKKSWEKPSLEYLDVKMTMKGIHHDDGKGLKDYWERYWEEYCDSKELGSQPSPNLIKKLYENL